jgi:hypothetical protein
MAFFYLELNHTRYVSQPNFIHGIQMRKEERSTNVTTTLVFIALNVYLQNFQ